MIRILVVIGFLLSFEGEALASLDFTAQGSSAAVTTTNPLVSPFDCNSGTAATLEGVVLMGSSPPGTREQFIAGQAGALVCVGGTNAGAACAVAADCNSGVCAATNEMGLAVQWDPGGGVQKVRCRCGATETAQTVTFDTNPHEVACIFCAGDTTNNACAGRSVGDMCVFKDGGLLGCGAGDVVNVTYGTGSVGASNNGNFLPTLNIRVEEVRQWTGAQSTTNLLANSACQISSSAPNLVSVWGMRDHASGACSGGQNGVDDAAATNNNAVCTGVVSPTWNSAIVTGACTGATPTVTVTPTATTTPTPTLSPTSTAPTATPTVSRTPTPTTSATPGPNDIWYVDQTCSNNGDGKASSCAGSPGGTGAWNSEANVSCAGGTTGVGPGDFLELRGESGQVYKRWDWPVACYGTAGNPVTVENFAGDTTIFDGTTDIHGSTWSSIGSGVFNCTSGTCGVSGQYPFAVWSLEGSGSEQENHIDRSSTACDSTVPAGMFRYVAGAVCLHLASGANPNTATYVKIPTDLAAINLQNGGGGDNITFRSNPSGGQLKIQRERVYGIARLFANSAQHFYNLDIGYVMDRCIDASGSGSLAARDNEMIGNTIHHCGQEGIRMESDLTGIVSNNNIYAIQVPPLFPLCTGTVAGCPAGLTDNGTGIRFSVSSGSTAFGNTIHEMGGGCVGDAQGISVEGGGDNITMDSNLFYTIKTLRSSGRGIWFNGATSYTGTIIKNNRFYDSDIGVQLCPSGPVTGGPTKIYNNTFAENLLASIDDANCDAGTASWTGSISITNNIFLNKALTPSAGLVNITNLIPGVNAFNYNTYDCPGCTTIVSFHGTNYRRGGLCTSDCINTLDPHSIYGDPLVDETGYPPTLKLTTAGGTAYNLGNTLSVDVPVDFEGAPRPQSVAFDIGADELGGPTPTPTTSPTPTGITPTPTITPTSTPTLSPTATTSPTNTPTPTPTSTPTTTPTLSPTSTFVPTSAATATATTTKTATPTFTISPSPTATPGGTSTPSPFPVGVQTACPNCGNGAGGSLFGPSDGGTTSGVVSACNKAFGQIIADNGTFTSNACDEALQIIGMTCVSGNPNVCTVTGGGGGGSCPGIACNQYCLSDGTNCPAVSPPAFSALTGGTNTTAGPMIVSGGASLSGNVLANDVSCNGAGCVTLGPGSTINNEIKGTLPIANGGTAQIGFITNSCVRFDGTSLVSAAGDCPNGDTTGGFVSGNYITITGGNTINLDPSKMDNVTFGDNGNTFTSINWIFDGNGSSAQDPHIKVSTNQIQITNTGGDASLQTDGDINVGGFIHTSSLTANKCVRFDGSELSSAANDCGTGGSPVATITPWDCGSHNLQEGMGNSPICRTATPSSTPTATSTPTVTVTATPTATSTPTITPTPTPTATVTITQLPTQTPWDCGAGNLAEGLNNSPICRTATPSSTPTATSTPTITVTATPTATATSTPTATPTSTGIATATPGSGQFLAGPTAGGATPGVPTWRLIDSTDLPSTVTQCGGLIQGTCFNNPVTIPPGVVVDWSSDANVGVLDAPRKTDCSLVASEGRACWDSVLDVWGLGDGSVRQEVLMLHGKQTINGPVNFYNKDIVTPTPTPTVSPTTTPVLSPTPPASTFTATRTPTPTATVTPEINTNKISVHELTNLDRIIPNNSSDSASGNLCLMADQTKACHATLSDAGGLGALGFATNRVSITLSNFGGSALSCQMNNSFNSSACGELADGVTPHKFSTSPATSSAAATVANTVTETSIIGTISNGSLTLPANFWRLGRVIRLVVLGTVGTTSSPTLNIKLYAGATVLCSTGANTLPTLTGNRQFMLEAYIQARSAPGASANIQCEGLFKFVVTNPPTVTAGALVLADAPYISELSSTTQPVSVATNVTKALDIKVTWGTANSLNTITGDIVTIESLN